MGKIKRPNEVWPVSLVLAISILSIVIMGVRGYGDGSTYYLMADSLIKDGDLILDQKDILRWRHGRFQNVPVGVYLLVDDKGIMRYAKPVLYPFLAAPFFLFFKKMGFALMNGLFLGGCIAACYLYLRKYFNRVNSLFIAALFFLCSFIPAYAGWIHPEMMLFFACAISMWLWLHKGKPAFSALVIGIASSAKILFLLLLVPLIAVLASRRNFKEIFRVMGMCFLGLSIMLILNFLFLGTFFPYGGLRGLVPPSQTSYVTLDAIRAALAIASTEFESIEFNSPRLFFRNISSFFIGRFTGIIWYAFPAVICAGIYLLYRQRIPKQEKILGDSILVAALLLAIILVITRPLNYFGGEDFICNRYFFILPSLLFLPAVRLIRKPKIVALAFLPGLLISSQIIKNEVSFKNWYSRHWENTHIYAQVAHTCAFPLKYAPLEIPQVESFFIYNLKISEDTFLYAPSGLKKQADKRILLGAGQEIVIVKENSIDSLKLKTEQDEIILQPRVILNSKTGRRNRSFYYFKANHPTWIKGV